MKKIICFLTALFLFSLAGFTGVANAQDTCYANGDANGDGLIWTVGDLVYALRILVCDATVPESLYRLDLTADCRVDTADLRIIEGYFIYGSGIVPRPFPVPTCCNPTAGFIRAAARGDLNADGERTPADVVLLLSCVFVGAGDCTFYADLNLDFAFTPADVVLELGHVFTDTQPSGCP